jgi:hypothetical protein
LRRVAATSKRDLDLAQTRFKELMQRIARWKSDGSTAFGMQSEDSPSEAADTKARADLVIAAQAGLSVRVEVVRPAP